MQPDLIFIGIVGRPHGLHGAFFVSSRQDPLPKSYKKIFIGASESAAIAADVTVSRMQGDRPVVQCTLASTREVAAALTGQHIFVPKSVVHAAHQDTALWSDVAGCVVVNGAGARIGAVIGLYDNGASGVVRISGDDGDVAEIPLVGALFDLQNVVKIRQEHILTCLLPDEAIAAYWSKALAVDDEPEGDRG